MRIHRRFLLLVIIGGLAVCSAQVITTVAGTNTNSYSGDGGPASSASLSTPLGMATDLAGNIFFADSGHFRRREVTIAGIINTVAGNGMVGFGLGGGNIGDGGPATSAELG